MDLIKSLNDAVNYVEDHLTDEIDSVKLAEISKVSIYYFQKIFTVLSGVPLSEYIRMRRLSQAARDLKNTNEKIINISLKYGYNSPTAFNRAFKAVHGISPSGARKATFSVKFYPLLSFKIFVEGAVVMEYKMVNMESFKVIGKKFETTMKDGVNFKEIPKFWKEVGADGTLQRLYTETEDPKGMLAVCVNDGKSDKLDYFIGVQSEGQVPAGFEEFIVPGAQFAVFQSVGPMPDAIQTLTKNIYAQWLPSSGYRMDTKGLDIEFYTMGDNTAADYKAEVWIAVEEKNY